MTQLNAFGLQMKSVKGRECSRSVADISPRKVSARVSSSAAKMPTRNRTPRARRERPIRVGRPRTSPTQSAASGPKSGPTTIAPTMRIGSSNTTPIAAIIVATAMNTRKVGDYIVSS